MVFVTNQQGIARGLMGTQDVETIHRNIGDELQAEGTTIDAIQVCPHLAASRCGCRKPEPGLIFDWLEGHPDVDSSLSVMVGDSDSDIELAQRVAAATGGCASVRIGNDSHCLALADASFSSLWDFAVAIKHVREEGLR